MPARIARDIQGLLPTPKLNDWSDKSVGDEERVSAADTGAMTLLRKTMTACFGVIRDQDGMRDGLSTILRLERENRAIALRQCARRRQD